MKPIEDELVLGWFCGGRAGRVTAVILPYRIQAFPLDFSEFKPLKAPCAGHSTIRVKILLDPAEGLN